MGLDFQAEVKDSSRIWIAAGFPDLRRVLQGLTTLIETVLDQAPYSGHAFVFRGKRGDLIKTVSDLGIVVHRPLRTRNRYDKC